MLARIPACAKLDAMHFKLMLALLMVNNFVLPLLKNLNLEEKVTVYIVHCHYYRSAELGQPELPLKHAPLLVISRSAPACARLIVGRSCYFFERYLVIVMILVVPIFRKTNRSLSPVSK